MRIEVTEGCCKRAKRKGLLPCPHCGGKAGLYEDWIGSWCVQCDRCGATTLKGSQEEVIRRWNRRVEQPQKNDD